MRFTYICMFVVLATCTPVMGQMAPDELKSKVREDVEDGSIGFAPCHVNMYNSELHYSLPIMYEKGSDGRMPLYCLYEVAQMRLKFSAESQKLFWEPLLRRAEEKVFRVIKEQSASGDRFDYQQASAFDREITAIFTEALQEYADDKNLRLIFDGNVQGSYSCKIVFTTTTDNAFAYVMRLTKFRMAEAMGDEIIPEKCKIGEEYFIPAGSYVYSFSIPGPENRPFKIRVTENGEIAL